MGGTNSVWNLGTLAVGTNSGSASSQGVGIQTFTQTAGLVLADKVRFIHFIGGTPGAYETMRSTYELGTADSAATLSINSIAIGSTEVTTKSRSTLKFNNGRIEAFDSTRTGGQTATGVQPATTALIAGGISVFDAQDDRRILHIELADTGTHTLAAGAGRTLEVSPTAVISGPGGVSIEGPGTVFYNTANTYAGLTTVNSGTLELARTATDIIRYGGGLDLRDGAVVFDYYQFSTPHSWVRTGVAASAATGFAAGQFRSGTANADYALGYFDDGSTVVLRRTLRGDADLNGVVDFDDFLALQNGFDSAVDWQGGNFDYLGRTDFNDFLILQNHFGQSMNGMPVAITAQQVAAMTAFARSVPEPAVTAVLLAALPLIRRRRVA
jgi:autotransporter-associated beta strand protein